MWTVVISSIVVVVFMVAGWLFLFGPWSQSQVQSSEASENRTARTGVTVVLDEITTNLNEPVRVYIQVTPEFTVSDQRAARALEANSGAVLDAILGILRSKTLADVHGSEGMAKLADEIRARADALLDQGEVRHVYFRNFIVQ